MKKHLVDQKVKTLDELGLEFGTDKASNHHDYLRTYEKYLEPLRDKELVFLELGFGGHEDPKKGGESIRMWQEYAPDWYIHCVEIEPKENTPDGIYFFNGSQTDPAIIETIVACNGLIDICVDDASHQSSLTIKSFENIFPLMKSGGIYIVEDTHSSLHSFWYGENEANENPKKNGKKTITALNYFKDLTDAVNNSLMKEEYRSQYEIESITFLKDLIIITKL